MKFSSFLKVLAAAGVAACASASAWAYEDAYIRTSDESVRLVELDDARVYVFTDYAQVHTLEAKRALVVSNVFIAAGGGSGGGVRGGGGGAGGVTNDVPSLSAGLILPRTAGTVVVGEGGARIAAGSWHKGNKGKDSTLDWGGLSYSREGGGAGSGFSSSAEESGIGGCGGGGCNNGNWKTGFAGTQGGKGGTAPSDQVGGGGGGAGGDASGQTAGPGVTCWITGEAVVYGKGGTGGWNANTPQTDAPDGLGQGGMGGLYGGGGDVAGGKGGGGTVIVRVTTVCRPMIVVGSSSGLYAAETVQYGAKTDVEAGTSYTFTAPSEVVCLNPEETARAQCTGWKVYDFATWTVLRTSENPGEAAQSCSITYDRPVFLEWQWATSCRCTASAVGNGTVSPTEVWGAGGESVTFTATPAEGWMVGRWQVNGADCGRALSIAPMVTDQPLAVSVTFVDQTFTWTGGGADNLASNPNNWSTGLIPYSGIAVKLDETSVKNLTWNLTDVEPASWNQTTGYTGVVTLNTVQTPGGYNALVVTGDMNVEGGILRCANAGASGEQIVGLDVRGDLTVGANAVISTTCKGMSTRSIGRDSTGATGCSHGGLGGVGSTTYTACKPCYGSIYDPVTYGSEPGRGDRTWGGGVIKIAVGGTLTVEGAISSSAFNACWNGGGSGGSVNITAGAIAGTGSGCNGFGGIWAQGPRRWYSTYDISGGGGRIAVTLTNETATFATFTGRIGARGMGAVTDPTIFSDNGFDDDLTPARGQYYFGQSYTTYAYSGAGTVYLRERNAAVDAGTLVIDQMRDLSLTHAQAYTEINATMSPDLRYGNVIIRNGGRLKVRDGVTVETSGVDNSAAKPGLLDNDATGVIRLVGDADGKAYLKGNLTFTALEIDPSVSELVMESGCDVSVSAVLTAVGSDGNLIKLTSSVPGTPAYLVVDDAAAVTLDYLEVTDIDASKGAALMPRHSKGNDASKGWVFEVVDPGETITWTGAAGTTDWMDKNNWLSEKGSRRTPIKTDFIVIPSVEGDVYPVLPAIESTFAHLTIGEGATLTMPDYPLTLTAGLSCAGTFASSASAFVTFAGETTFAGTATVSRVRFPAGAVCRFSADAKFVSADVFQALGTTETPVSLVPSQTGGTWMLESDKSAIGFTRLVCVTLTGCRATGSTLYPQQSTVTDCQNVDTETTVRYWTGVVSDDPAVAANWDPEGCPDSACVLAVDVRMTPRAPRFNGQDQSYAGLSVVGGTVALDKPVVVSGDVMVAAGAALTHTVLPSTDDKNGESYRLDLTVGGDMTVEPGALIDLRSKGYDQKKGPGSYTGSWAHASHGGGVNVFGGGISQLCYGSIFAPTNAGSGTCINYTPIGLPHIGGGVGVLNVAGRLTLDGDVEARPSGCCGGYFGASGGSVWIRAGELAGCGNISVQGGWTKSDSAGGGGRVALVLTKKGATFADYTGTVTAYGGSNRVPADLTDPCRTDAANGTVYTRTADEPHGTIFFENQETISTSAFTDLGYDAASCDLREASLRLGRNARVRLTADVEVADLVDIDPTAKLFLNGHKLIVHRRSRKEIKALVGTNVIADGGKIVWLSGLAVIVR